MIDLKTSIQLYYPNTNTSFLASSLKFAPNYDYEHCGKVRFDKFAYSFKLQCKRVKQVQIPSKTIQDFLSVESRENIEKFKNKLTQIQSLSIAEIFEEMEERIEKKIPYEIKLSLEFGLEKNWESIRKLVK